MGNIVNDKSLMSKSVSGSIKIVNKNPNNGIPIFVYGDELVIESGEYEIVTISDAPVAMEKEAAVAPTREAPKTLAPTKTNKRKKSLDPEHRKRMTDLITADRGHKAAAKREVRPQTASQVLSNRRFADPSTGTNVDGVSPRPIGVDGLS